MLNSGLDSRVIVAAAPNDPSADTSTIFVLACEGCSSGVFCSNNAAASDASVVAAPCVAAYTADPARSIQEVNTVAF